MIKAGANFFQHFEALAHDLKPGLDHNARYVAAWNSERGREARCNGIVYDGDDRDRSSGCPRKSPTDHRTTCYDYVRPRCDDLVSSVRECLGASSPGKALHDERLPFSKAQRTKL